MNVTSLLDTLAASIASPSSASSAPLSKGGSFSEVLGLEQSGLASTSAFQETLGTAVDPKGETAEALNNLLLKLGDALEEMDDVALVALTQLIFSLESTGPVGIRVESGGVKSAALPSAAENFWNQLLQLLQQKNLPLVTKSDGATQASDQQLQSLGSWIQAWLKNDISVNPLESGAQQVSAEGVQGAVSISSKENTQEQADSIGMDGKLDIPKGADANANLKKGGLEIPNALALDEAEEVAKLDLPKPEEESEEAQAGSLEKSNSDQSEDKKVELSAIPKTSSSAVVVLTEKSDRLRAVVVQALQKRLGQNPVELKSNSIEELEDGAWAKIKNWLKDAANTAAEKAQSLSSSISGSSKALEFIQFVNQRRQMGWETALSQSEETQDSDGNKKATGKKDVLASERWADAQTPSAPVQKSPPLFRAYGLGLPVSPQLPEVLTPAVATELPKELEASSKGEAKRESSEQSALSQDHSSQRPSNGGSTALPQVHRADTELFDRFINHAKTQLRLWVDRKLVAMEVQLEPADLGRMHMKTVLENGRIGVLFQVENQQVKDLLLQQSQALKDVLAGQGLEVAGFYVEVWQGDRNQGKNSFSKTGAGPEFDMDKLLGQEGASGEASAPSKRGLIDSVA